MVASSSDGLPPVQIEDFRAIDKENYNIVFSTTASNKLRSYDDYNRALSSITDNKLGIVEGSLFKIESSRGKPHLRCIASANREVLEYKGENSLKEYKMRTLQANVLEDSNGHIWRIVGQGDSKQIIQVSEDNYTELLAKRRKFSQMTASDEDFEIGYQDTDYVYFFNPAIEAMDFGFAVTTAKDTWVVSHAQRKEVRVNPSQIMEACSTDGKGLNLSAKRRELVAASSSAIADYINHLKDIYGKNSEYVRMWSKLLTSSPSLVK
jgi:hypothetical protein